MVVALPASTGCGQTLFGANVHGPVNQMLSVRCVSGHTFALGEVLRTAFVSLPQIRRNCTVMGVRAAGSQGYVVGVNEHRVTVGCCNWKSRCRGREPGLLGPELVRVALERGQSARHALQVLTDLVARFGQGDFPGNNEGEDADHVFLVADPTEAFIIEAAGSGWAGQEIHQVRAASDVAVIRQDWYCLAPGFADRAIAEGWSSCDGNKLDFIGTLSESPTGKASALRRWGRATLLLEQQNGHLDSTCFRRILADHYDGTRFEVDPIDGNSLVTPLCRHAGGEAKDTTAASAIIQLPLDPGVPAVFWLAVGPPCIGVHFPLLLQGDLPTGFCGEPAALWTRMRQLADHLGKDPRRWLQIRASMARLQTRFDQDIDEFNHEAIRLVQRGERVELGRLAGSLMQSHVERFEESALEILDPQRPAGIELPGVLSGMAVF